MKPATNNQNDLYLPDFCSIRVVFAVVIIAELAAFVLALAPLDVPLAERWNNLGLISFFIQWCALACAAVLCVLRPYLRKLGHVTVSILSFSLIMLVIIVISEGAFRFFNLPLYGEMENTHLNFLLHNMLIGSIISGTMLRYFYIQHQWRLKLKTETQARLQALQSRIRPHFLFNSMNTIASLTRIDPLKAEAAVEHLSDLFRASLIESKESQSLEEEFELCRGYLEIESLRLGDRLQVKWQVESLPKDARVPPLLLQPLLENAVYHGIEPLPEGGVIVITGHLDNQCIHLDIDNPLPQKETARNKQGHQIAQSNIRERLQALYGAKAGLDLQIKQDGYHTSIFFPYITQSHEDTYRR